MTDTKEEIICPACGRKMVKIQVAGVNIDICLNGCGGIWFDNRELEKFDQQEENIEEIANAVKGKTFNWVNTDEDRECPVCHRKMVKHFQSPVNKVTIDDCYSCGGKFLDYKELERIKESSDENIDSVMTALYRKNGYIPYKAQKSSILQALTNLYNIL